VRVAQALVGDEFEILAAKRVAAARGEVPKGHLVAAADPRLQLVNRAGKAVGRQPLRHRIGLEEGAIDLLRRRREDSMKADSVGHGLLPVAELLMTKVGDWDRAKLCWVRLELAKHHGHKKRPLNFLLF